MPHMGDIVVTKADTFPELRDSQSRLVSDQITIQIIN